MPKIVDHDERRREVLEATWRVIARKGLDGTTIREIAQEVGYSNGVLAHYFKNKDDIIRQAHLLAYRRAGERIRATMGDRTGLAALRHALLHALPLDDERLLEARIEVGAWQRALSSPELAEVKQQSLNYWREFLLSLVRAARQAGDIDSPRPDDLLVHEIIVLVDALSVEAVLHPGYATRERQLQLADALLERLVRPGGHPA
jgi:AcrR family transcriptional regulator